MLILTRRIGESLKVGPDITVTVMGIKGQQVRIGIDAPKDVTVLREEIADRNKQEKTAPACERPGRRSHLCYAAFIALSLNVVAQAGPIRRQA